MLKKIINYCKGCVTVEVTGAAIERFLNVCAANHIGFWDTRRLDVHKLRATVTLEGFFLIRRHAKKCMCRIRVVGKRGLPFNARRMEGRYALWLGIVLSIGIVWFLSGFIWTVGIEGCERISQMEILTLLEREGLAIGARRGNVDANDIKNTLLAQMEELVFLAVNIKGTHAQVVVRERIIPPAVVQQDVPCDVISDKTGVIVALRVMTGKAMVKVGETLMPGDVIAVGTLTSTQNETWQVHASAEADLRTWYTERRLLPDSVQVAVPTGRQVVRRALVAGNRRFNLYLVESAPFSCYDKIVKTESLSLSDNFRFPLTLITETYIETTMTAAAIDGEKSSAWMESRMGDNLAAAKPEAVVEKTSYRFAAIEGGFEGILEVECIETTGVEYPIEGE